jgi:hypothetical protein
MLDTTYEAGRDWMMDCDSSFEANGETPTRLEVLVGVRRCYDGGWPEFLAASDLRDPELELTIARRLAMEHEDTWGDRVTECYTHAELAKDIAESDSLRDWIEEQEIVHDVHDDVRCTEW